MDNLRPKIVHLTVVGNQESSWVVELMEWAGRTRLLRPEGAKAKTGLFVLGLGVPGLVEMTLGYVPSKASVVCEFQVGQN